MEKFYCLVLWMLVITLCFSGCGIKDQEVEVPSKYKNTSIDVTDESVSQDGNLTQDNEDLNNTHEEQIELLYQTSVTFDEERNVQRTTLDTQGYPLSVYFEIPVINETVSGHEKINTFFKKLRDDFFSSENENLNYAWETATTTPLESGTYCFRCKANIREQTEQYISVGIRYEWWMGGVNDYGGDSYFFSTKTGEQLCLTDIIDYTEEEIKEIIFLELEEKKDKDEDGIMLDLIEDYDLDDFEFSILDGKVYILFDKYEVANGAYGGFDIELPVQLNFDVEGN